MHVIAFAAAVPENKKKALSIEGNAIALEIALGRLYTVVIETGK